MSRMAGLARNLRSFCPETFNLKTEVGPPQKNAKNTKTGSCGVGPLHPLVIRDRFAKHYLSAISAFSCGQPPFLGSMFDVGCSVFGVRCDCPHGVKAPTHMGRPPSDYPPAPAKALRTSADASHASAPAITAPIRSIPIRSTAANNDSVQALHSRAAFTPSSR